MSIYTRIMHTRTLTRKEQVAAMCRQHDPAPPLCLELMADLLLRRGDAGVCAQKQKRGNCRVLVARACLCIHTHTHTHTHTLSRRN